MYDSYSFVDYLNYKTFPNCVSLVSLIPNPTGVEFNLSLSRGRGGQFGHLVLSFAFRSIVNEETPTVN